MTGRFGLRRFFNGEARSPHAGFDIASRAVRPSSANAHGIVLASGDYFFNGRTVFVDHGNGLMSVYCHLDRVDVQAGDAVVKGQRLGLVGMSGRATGPHLHWGVVSQRRPGRPAALRCRSRQNALTRRPCASGNLAENALLEENMRLVIWVLWPAFIAAGIAEAIFFTLIDPAQLYLLGQRVEWSAMATYSTGFLLFWLVCIGSSLMTYSMMPDVGQGGAAQGGQRACRPGAATASPGRCDGGRG
jgi:murein DD-endopeptidase MepM/ murein hydrolase activator NlpD